MEQFKTTGRAQTAALGGIFLSVVGSLTWQDLLKTVVLGAIGTAVSFIVSSLLEKLRKKGKKI